MLRQLKTNDINHLSQEMQYIRVENAGINKMQPKGEFLVLKTSPLRAPACNILKQQMLSIGGECAVAKGIVNCNIESSPAILMGTRKQYLSLIKSLTDQCFGLEDLKEELLRYFNKVGKLNFTTLNHTFDLSKKTLLMGILNLTPDSFSDGGKYNSEDLGVERALKMIDDGVDIIDIGGESTKPGSNRTSQKEELERIIPVIKKLRKKTNIPISVDTYKSKVAEATLDEGADIINDISGLMFDSEMSKIIAKYNAGAVLMHIKGAPKNMQTNPQYDNIIDEILIYLEKSAQLLMDTGLNKSNIAIDPGIGFGKQLEENYIILRYLEEFKSLGQPILVGPSRKSFIGNLLNLPVDERLEGTISSIACSIMNGANIVRVHDIKETYRTIKIADKIMGKY